jgi:hypothetical protein
MMTAAAEIVVRRVIGLLLSIVFPPWMLVVTAGARRAGSL